MWQGDPDSLPRALKRAKTIAWKSGEQRNEKIVSSWKIGPKTYTASFKLKSDNYYGHQLKHILVSLYFGSIKEGKIIGSLKGNLLQRPSPFFYGMADSESYELQWLATMFGNSVGHLTNIVTNLPEQDIYGGGFLHLDSVSVEDEHMGHDLGLRLIHETFVFLQNRWNLAVMCPLPVLDFNNTPDSDRKEKMKMATIKLTRHFARIGFEQAGRNIDEWNAWNLSSLIYFGSATSPKSPVEAMEQWKTKSQVQHLDIYLPAEKYEPTGVNKELADLVHEATREAKNQLGPMLRNMQSLVENKNASIYGSRALWIILSVTSEGPNDQAILRHLLELGRHDINRADEHGNRPLHIAAQQYTMNLDAIQMLLQFGADRNVNNEKGETPIQSLQERKQRGGLFSCSVFSPLANIYLNCVTELMDNQSKILLVDGWLSPRMRKMLFCTAQEMCITIRQVRGQGNF